MNKENIYMKTHKNGPVRSNTDSGAKIRACCRDMLPINLYLAFIVRNLLLVKIKKREK
jgi:hypothetical protein